MEYQGPSIEANFSEFKKMASEFFVAARTATLEECEAGHKCLALAYLGLDGITKMERHEAVILLNLAHDEIDKHDPVMVKGKAALARLKEFCAA